MAKLKGECQDLPRISLMRRCSRRGSDGRTADGGAAQDGVGGVEDGGLAFGYAAGGVVETDAEVVAV